VTRSEERREGRSQEVREGERPRGEGRGKRGEEGGEVARSEGRREGRSQKVRKGERPGGEGIEEGGERAGGESFPQR